MKQLTAKIAIMTISLTGAIANCASILPSASAGLSKFDIRSANVIRPNRLSTAHTIVLHGINAFGRAEEYQVNLYSYADASAFANDSLKFRNQIICIEPQQISIGNIKCTSVEVIFEK